MSSTWRFPSVMGVVDVLFHPGAMAVLLFRLAAACHHAHLRPISRLLYIWNVVLFGVDIAPTTYAGPGLVLPHPVGVSVQGNVRLGRNAHLFQGVKIGGAASEDPGRDGFPVIGDDCWIFTDAVILGPVTIGDGAFVGVKALVVRSVPAGAVAAGNPARVVRRRAVPSAKTVVPPATAPDPGSTPPDGAIAR